MWPRRLQDSAVFEPQAPASESLRTPMLGLVLVAEARMVGLLTAAGCARRLSSRDPMVEDRWHHSMKRWSEAGERCNL
ncbi:hypothetical protein PoMZ_06996 [Pyricularia oryzae]|uniref:Uncharacterized protein n=1 Tax=Pyricularia oryzae TaxID=318829 RepID=A0A4P7NSJ0_PYROR|nr:hypothetical protein PoMZ_06996 [Pyricularia oryzae]